MDRNLAQMDDRVGHIVAVKGIALTARQNRRRYFVDLGGRQDKHGMIGWLFEGFEQRVERRSRQHVHFVDDVNLVAANCRAELHALDDFASIIDTGMRGGVHFDDVDGTAICNRQTHATAAAWPISWLGHAVDCLGEQTSDGRFADTTWPRKYIGMTNPPVNDCITQCADDMFLADKFVECL